MKTLVSNYTFDASAKTITFDDYASIDLERVLLITNTTDNIIIYNFASAAKGGTVATNVLTLTHDTTSMDDADDLQIYYDDDNASSFIKDYYQENALAYAEELNLIAGDTITPAAGKRIMYIKSQIAQKPSNETYARVDIGFVSTGTFFKAYNGNDNTVWIGDIDEPLDIALTADQPATVNIRYREID
jgi:hypothetical protein